MAPFTADWAQARTLVWYAARCPDLVYVRTNNSGTRVYQFTCPVHDDHNPSCLLFLHKNGRIRVHCGSQPCRWQDIIAALEQVTPVEHPHNPDDGAPCGPPRHKDDLFGRAEHQKRKGGRAADPDFAGRPPYSAEDLDALEVQLARLDGPKGHTST